MRLSLTRTSLSLASVLLLDLEGEFQIVLGDHLFLMKMSWRRSRKELMAGSLVDR